jgi:predicted NBD/HSP70 family sugar kinase
LKLSTNVDSFAARAFAMMDATDTTGDMNSLRIRRAIWLRPGISRAELARELGLDKAAVTRIVAGLLEIGLVADSDKRASGPRGGRKPISLSVNASFGCVLGIELQTECYRADVIDASGEVLLRNEEPIDLSRASIVDAFRGIFSVMRSRIEDLGLPLMGIGLGVPGIVDPRSGMIAFSRPLQIVKPYSFYEELARSERRHQRGGPSLKGIPVMIDNDARCGCWSVLSHHRADSPANFLFLFGELRSVDRTHRLRRDLSVGFGIVLERRVYYGDEGASGEFISAFREADHENQFSVSDIEAQAIRTDRRIRRRVLAELARNAALVANVINVTTLYLGGSILAYADELVARLKEEARRHSTSPMAGSFAVRLTVHGEHVVAYGAAGMVLERFFGVPDLRETLSRSRPTS